MVAPQFDNTHDASRFLIRTNCSLSRREAVLFYVGICTVTFGIAFAFAVQGAWLVLPFAGLEMLALGVALYLVARRSSDWQMVSINKDSVEVTSHTQNEDFRQIFQRAWARVVHEHAPIKGHPSKLTIRSHGRSLEIGRSLNENEKYNLAQQLGVAIRPVYQ